MARVVIVGLFHETNTFATATTDQGAFEAEGWYRGNALLDHYLDTQTVIGGFCDGLLQLGHTPVGAFGAFAVPAGRVSSAAWTAIHGEVFASLEAAGPYDGVLIELHGAMVSTDSDDPEGDLLTALRTHVGSRPMVAVTDLHANMTPARLQATDVLVGYRTNPHVDTWETGRSAARHLSDLLNGAPRPHVVFATAPVIAPAIAQATTEWPMAGWLLRGAELERRHDFADVTLHGGYAYADVAHAGMAVTITSRGPVHIAESAATELCELAWAMRHHLTPEVIEPHVAVRNLATTQSGRGPVGFADTGDNINGGGPGDRLELLTAFAAAGVHALATWVHPELLHAARDAEVGESVDLPAPLVRATGRVAGLKVSDFTGTFVNRGPMATGKRMNICHSVVLRVGKLDVLLQGRATQPNDPEMFRSAGLEPADYDAVLLKGASALRAGWAGVVEQVVAVATPGATDSDLRRLPYQRLTGRVWPLAVEPERPITVARIR